MPQKHQPKAQKSHKSHKAGFQIGQSKLLRGARDGGTKQGQGQGQGQGQAKGGKSAANRDEVQKQLAALRERAAAKSFKKAPEPKVVLAAPLFHLPTKQELLLQPQQHPMDLLLFDEAPKESGQQARLKKSIPQQQQQQQPITLHPGFLSHIRHNGDPDEDL